MEYAIQINKVKALDKVNDQYSRIYYGNEFCPHLCFHLEELKKVIGFCLTNEKKLTLVTSYIVEDNVQVMEKIFEYLVQNEIHCEIVVNDLGLLYYLNEKYHGKFDLVLGCMLNKMKKSPVVMNLIEKVNEEVKEALETASINLMPTWDILKKNNIKRVEFENPLQGNRIEEDMPFERSLRYPYVFITTARKCMVNYCVQDLKHYEIDKCSRSCEDTYLCLYNKIMQRELYLKGNTLFYKNDILSEAFEKQFSRVVVNSFIVRDE